MVEETIQPEQHESIKLIKNSKGYNWEIKIFNAGSDILWLTRLDDLNKELEAKYGEKEQTD